MLGVAAIVLTMTAGRVADAASPPAPTATPAAQPAVPAARSVTPARADAAIDAFDRAFYVERGGRGYFLTTTASRDRYAVFWRTAEMIEMVEDAAERSSDGAYRHMVTELTRGVAQRFGGTWTGRRYNDDVMWMVLAFERASRITGDTRLRDVARRNFDATFARGWSGDFGGGLWWTTDRHEKNACVNAPAAIAALRLAESTHQDAYLRKAERLYAWVRTNLYDEGSGAVYDHVWHDGGHVSVDRATYTYNQGTFAGAARLLSQATGDPRYWDDARDALAYARDRMGSGGLLPGEGGGDGGGFKGILARYAGDYLRHDTTRAYEDWMALNGDAAWSCRDPRGLMGQDWSRRTDGGELRAFDASSAVALLQQLRGR
jgi:predicted alpha-1,6-mannanase (GH76 family)